MPIARCSLCKTRLRRSKDGLLYCPGCKAYALNHICYGCGKRYYSTSRGSDHKCQEDEAEQQQPPRKLP